MSCGVRLPSLKWMDMSSYLGMETGDGSLTVPVPVETEADPFLPLLGSAHLRWGLEGSMSP